MTHNIHYVNQLPDSSIYAPPLPYQYSPEIKRHPPYPLTMPGGQPNGLTPRGVNIGEVRYYATDISAAVYE